MARAPRRALIQGYTPPYASLPQVSYVEPEVLAQQRDEVGGRLAREHALHDALVARVALRLVLEDPAARLRAEDVLARAARRRRARCCAPACRRHSTSWQRSQKPTIAVPCTAEVVARIGFGASARRCAPRPGSISAQVAGYFSRSQARSAGPGTTKSNHTDGAVRVGARVDHVVVVVERAHEDGPSTTAARGRTPRAMRRNWSSTHSCMNSLNEVVRLSSGVR